MRRFLPRALRSGVFSRTLSRDLATGLVGVIALVLFCVGLFIYVVNERKTENELRFQAEELSDELAELLVPHVVAVDRDRILHLVRAYLQGGALRSVRVLDARDAILARAQQRGVPGGEDTAFELSRELYDEQGLRGRLIATFSHQPARERHRELLISILLVFGFVTVTVVYSTRLLLQRLLAAPLEGLRRGIDRIARGDYRHPLPSLPQRDLNAIVESANRMARQIERRDMEIKDYAASLESANRELERKIFDLERAQLEIRNSEEKYKHLVESSSDIIFSLDGSGRIVTINAAVHRLLGWNPDGLAGRQFTDLLFRFDEKTADLREKLVLQHIQNLRESRRPAVFRMDFRTSQDEPRELDVRLEIMRENGDAATLIFGKAGSAPEDVISRHCSREVRRYVIGNYITVADQLAHVLVTSTAPRLEDEDDAGIRIGLREILINAIEHGNLGISFDEKSAAINSGEYYQLIAERQRDPRYRDRKVTIIYSLSKRRASFLVRDEGGGFDFEDILQQEPMPTDVYHGRGIAIACRFFDTVRYRGRGNEVVLIKNFEQIGPV